MRGVVKGKRWLLPTRWMNLDSQKRQQLNELFVLNRRVMKAYLLKESLERLWTYRYEGAMLRYLQSWIDQLRWQPWPPSKNLPSWCRIAWTASSTTAAPRFPLAWWKPSTETSRPFIEGAAATKTCAICCSWAQRMAVAKTEFIVLQKAA